MASPGSQPAPAVAKGDDVRVPSLAGELNDALRNAEQGVVASLKDNSLALVPPSPWRKLLACYVAVAVAFIGGALAVAYAVGHGDTASPQVKLLFAAGLGVLVAGFFGLGIATELWRVAHQREQRMMDLTKWILARTLVEQITDEPARLSAQLALVEHLTGVEFAKARLATGAQAGIGRTTEGPGRPATGGSPEGPVDHRR